MGVNIRKAVSNDCERILALVQELAEYEKSPKEVTISLQHFKDSGFGETPVWWAFIAEVENYIVGFALYYIRFSTWKGKTMYLEDILVTEKMRGNQIGSLLFERLLKEAKAKDIHHIAWQVLEWNKPAINFYKKYNASFESEWVNCSINIS